MTIQENPKEYLSVAGLIEQLQRLHPWEITDVVAIRRSSNPDSDGGATTRPLQAKLNMDIPFVVSSVYESQDSILSGIQHLHCPLGFDADLTFGNGGFWRKHERPPLCYDATPLYDGVVKADSARLPIESASIGSAVFDPPFLTYIKGGRSHKGGGVAMSNRFGGYYAYSELEMHYCGTLSEAYRVLRPLGRLVFKCQDIIHNHKMHCTHAKVINWAEARGFRLMDLFVMPAKYRMPSPQKGIQRHARIFHSYFLVFERNRNPWKPNP